jgi:hypothetical protein
MSVTLSNMKLIDANSSAPVDVKTISATTAENTAGNPATGDPAPSIPTPGMDPLDNERKNHTNLSKDDAGENPETHQIPTPPAPSNTHADPESVHILLQHLGLLALAHHPSRPVIDYNVRNQILQLDAFLVGTITGDGLATQWHKESRTQDRIDQYIGLCATLVPNLIAAIKKQSDENFGTEAKNRGVPPVHGEFYQIMLRPDLVTQYGELVEKWSKKKTPRNPDLDPWTDTAKFSDLIELLQDIVDSQYDFDKWEHVPPKPVFNQQSLNDTVELSRDMEDPDFIYTWYQMKTPGGKTFSNWHRIPEIETAVASDPQYDVKKLLKEKGRAVYFIPDPLEVTIPRRRKTGDNKWKEVDGPGNRWTRGEDGEEEVWEPTIVFYLLDKATNKLLRVYTIAAALMDKIDLNDDDNHKGWVSAYRKKIAQWRQRATKEATKVRDHWDDEEKNIMYQWANTFVKDKGIDMLTTKAVDGERNDLLDLLNKTIPGTRNAEGVSAWVKGQMKRKSDSLLGILFDKAGKVRRQLKAGATVPNSERYPDNAITIPVPQKKVEKKRASRRKPMTKSSKDDPSAEEEIDEGNIHDPQNYNLEGGFDEDLDLVNRNGEESEGDDFNESDEDDSHNGAPRPSLFKEKNKRVVEEESDDDFASPPKKKLTVKIPWKKHLGNDGELEDGFRDNDAERGDGDEETLETEGGEKEDAQEAAARQRAEEERDQRELDEGCS